MSPTQPKDPKGPPFRIRSRFRDGEEELSKKEILKRITSGKLNGEEEVSPSPYDSWQKLSSHPLFYDAFLKRLFADNYQSPDPEALKDEPSLKKTKRASEKSVIDRATRQADPNAGGQGPEDSREDQGKTRQIRDLREPGATVHQSAIDELFNDGSQEAAVPQAEPVIDDPGGGTALVKIDGPSPPSSEPTIPFEAAAFNMAPEPAVAPTQEELIARAEEEKAATANRVRRRLFLGVVLVVLLTMLFFSGNEEAPKKPKAEETTKAAKTTIPGNTSKESKVTALSREGGRAFVQRYASFLPRRAGGSARGAEL